MQDYSSFKKLPVKETTAFQHSPLKSCVLHVAYRRIFRLRLALLSVAGIKNLACILALKGAGC